MGLKRCFLKQSFQGRFERTDGGNLMDRNRELVQVVADWYEKDLCVFWSSQIMVAHWTINRTRAEEAKLGGGGGPAWMARWLPAPTALIYFLTPPPPPQASDPVLKLLPVPLLSASRFRAVSSTSSCEDPPHSSWSTEREYLTLSEEAWQEIICSTLRSKKQRFFSQSLLLELSSFLTVCGSEWHPIFQDIW